LLHGPYFALHPEDPQQRLIRRAVEIVRNGGLMVYPTDSCYALGCHIGDKSAMERVRRIRQVDENHHFTLVCRDLSELGQYAIVDNIQYRAAQGVDARKLYIHPQGEPGSAQTLLNRSAIP